MAKHRKFKVLKINLSDLAVLELEQLQLKTQSPSMIELIKDCLSLLKFLVEESDKGNQILIQDQKGRIVSEIVILKNRWVSETNGSY